MKQALLLIAKGFEALQKQFSASQDSSIMTDVIIQVSPSTGQITFLDDDDNIIYSAHIHSWNDTAAEELYPEAEKLLRNYIANHSSLISSLSIIKPYSILLVDEDKETLAELHLEDDELIALDTTELMENLDKDLDDFFDKLMKE